LNADQALELAFLIGDELKNSTKMLKNVV